MADSQLASPWFSQRLSSAPPLPWVLNRITKKLAQVRKNNDSEPSLYYQKCHWLLLFLQKSPQQSEEKSSLHCPWGSLRWCNKDCAMACTDEGEPSLALKHKVAGIKGPSPGGLFKKENVHNLSLALTPLPLLTIACLCPCQTHCFFHKIQMAAGKLALPHL